MRYVVVLLLLCVIGYPIAAPALQPPVTETSSPDLIRSVWGKKLNPSGSIPETGFKAIYFSRNNPDTVVFEENVDSIAIKYAWSEFHNIESPQFAAYWVGKLKFEAPASRQISVSQSWAKSRIFIDGELVFGDENDSKTFTHEFSAGEHVIEVEYINNWHTVEYKVTIGEPHVVLDTQGLAAYFAENPHRSARLYYFSLYESGARDTRVNVSLPRTGRPVILWLSSYEAVDWNIVAPDRISAVIVGSYAPGSRVSGAPVGEVLHARDSPRLSRESRRCSCSPAGNLYCEDRDDLMDVAQRLRSTTGLELSGYAVAYSAKDMVPQPYGGDTVSRVTALKAANAAAERQCTRRTNPDFDTMFNETGAD